MRQVLTIAVVTIHEALRRRLVAAFGAIALVLVGMSAWGFDRLSHSSSLTSGEVQVSVPQSLVLFMFMFSFVVALSASAMSSPAVASELESGVIQTVAARPIRRSEILLGKWLGLTALLAFYAAIVCLLEFAVVDWVSGFTPPDPAAVGLYLFGEGVVLLTLALAVGTRLPALATGVTAVAAFGAAWLGGVVGSLGQAFQIGALRAVGNVVHYLVPTDGLWRGAIYYLEPSSFIAGRFGGRVDPFFVASPPGALYILFAVVWFVAVLALALWSFNLREL